MSADELEQRASVRDEPGLATLVQRLADESRDLAAVELKLARAEFGAVAMRWGGAIALLWMGSVMVMALVIVAALAATLALAPVFQSLAIAALMVALALVVLAAVMALIARSMLRGPRKPASLLFQWLTDSGEAWRGQRHGSAQD
jgi:hypothetical protein